MAQRNLNKLHKELYLYEEESIRKCSTFSKSNMILRITVWSSKEKSYTKMESNCSTNKIFVAERKKWEELTHYQLPRKPKCLKPPITKLRSRFRLWLGPDKNLTQFLNPELHSHWENDQIEAMSPVNESQRSCLLSPASDRVLAWS